MSDSCKDHYLRITLDHTHTHTPVDLCNHLMNHKECFSTFVEVFGGCHRAKNPLTLQSPFIKLMIEPTAVSIAQMKPVQNGGECYSQYIAYDSHTPHICGESDWFVLHDFRSHEFWSAEEHSEIPLGIPNSRQPEVNDFDSVPWLREAEDVLRLWS